MAEVTNLHSSPPRRPVFTVTGPHQEEPYARQEPREYYHQFNPFAFDFDLFSHPNRSSNPSFFDDYNVTTVRDEPNCFYIAADDRDEEEELNFVTDLFESRPTSLLEDPIWERDTRVEAEPSPAEFGFGPGLRVVDMDSESDSEEFEVSSGFIDNYDGYGINSNNSFHSNGNERDEFEWEEVSEREGETMNSLINRIEEISVSSSSSSSSDISDSLDGHSTLGDDDLAAEEEVQSIEWEVLLAVNNLERELEDLTGSRGHEDYILAVEYNALFGAMVENETAMKGSPPASKSAVESLPVVAMTNGGLVCAVCKDEFVIGEKATRMPCGHDYHGDCIFPWLAIRNTCPVCRHELPTDDKEYEKGRGRGGGGGGGGGVDYDWLAAEFVQF